MVHALREIWRVLVEGEYLVDFRPLRGHRPLDIVVNGKVMPAGKIDRTMDEADDIACDKALARVSGEGMFVQQRTAFFDYADFWDSVQDLKAHVKENWDNKRIKPRKVLTMAHRLMVSSGDHAKLRIRTKMVISRYRKVSN